MNNTLMAINHIVVLTLENRSFDHMLGYLSREGGRTDIDGLTGCEVNEYGGQPYTPKRMTKYRFKHDPSHDWESVEQQLADNNGGFIRNFACVESKPKHPEEIMNYHDGSQLRVFDHLASQFCICDRWFSAIPGATHPNRVYSLAGQSDGIKKNFTPRELGQGAGWTIKTIFERLPASVTWRYYSHDFAALRLFKTYRRNVKDIDKIDKFYESAANGNLPNICWIDPDFGYFISVPRGAPNDDHPPHDVRHGQNLVRKIYNALLNAGNNLWEKTLFIVFYDEHGGFYDHVSPKQWTPADDSDEFRQYGVRVSAFIISPWVGKRVAYGSRHHHLRPKDVTFDHTSILKTILLRFCTSQKKSIPWMSARVASANDLGALLTERRPRTDCTPAPILNVPRSLSDFYRVKLENVPVELQPKRPPEEMPQQQGPHTELQEAFQALADVAIAEGVPREKL